MSALEKIESFIKFRVQIMRKTHKQISEELQANFPGERGFSVRSIERFCSEKGIKKMSQLSDREVDMIVSEAIAQVDS